MRVCVASDVAARGLDLPQCSLVVHADLPQNRASLLHRSGRTGRAGRSGLSVMVVPHWQRRWADALIAQAGVTVRWVRPPWLSDIARRDQVRLGSDPLLSAPPFDAERATAALLLANHGAERLAVAFWRRCHAGLPVGREISDGDPAARPPAGVWFTLDRGSRDGAMVSELLPMICRIGRLRRKDILRLRLLEDETQFELTPAAASGFAGAAACEPSSGAQIRRLAGPPPRSGGGRGRRPAAPGVSQGQSKADGRDASPPEPPAEA